MLVNEKDTLLKKLVDIEHEGKEASYELNKLKETCQKLKKVKKEIYYNCHSIAQFSFVPVFKFCKNDNLTH